MDGKVVKYMETILFQILIVGGVGFYIFYNMQNLDTGTSLYTNRKMTNWLYCILGVLHSVLFVYMYPISVGNYTAVLCSGDCYICAKAS